MGTSLYHKTNIASLKKSLNPTRDDRTYNLNINSEHTGYEFKMRAYLLVYFH